MRLSTLSAVVLATTFIAVPSSAASKGPNAKAGGPHAKAAGPKTTGPKTTRPKSGGPKTTVTTTTSTKTTGPKVKATSTVPKSHGGSKKSAVTSTTTATTTTGMPPAAELNPIAQKITSKKGLSTKVNGMLPSGMTLDQASKGFKNQGQFLAALHVSQNLQIPFADLKTAMTGIRPATTTSGGTTEPTQILSLGQAIKKLRPGTDAAAAESLATKQATADSSGK